MELTQNDLHIVDVKIDTMSIPGRCKKDHVKNSSVHSANLKYKLVH